MTHVEDLAWLAASTDRHLVLPNGSESRYGIARPHNFSLFHDIDALRRTLELPRPIRFYEWPDYVAYAQRCADAGEPVQFEQLTIRERAIVSVQRRRNLPRSMRGAVVDGRLPPQVIYPRRNVATKAAKTIEFVARRPAEALSVQFDAFDRFFVTPRIEASNWTESASAGRRATNSIVLAALVATFRRG